MSKEYGEAVAVLMRAPLGGFVAARADMVRALRKQGNPDLAKHIAALRRPSLILWALNQAGTATAGELDELRAAGDRLRRAQAALLQGDRSAVEQMSPATLEHRRAVDTVTRRLGMVITAAGHAASAETLRRLSDDLRNASFADAGEWSALRAGRLLSEPAPATFPALDETGLKRVFDAHAEHAAGTHRKQLAAAEADVRRAEELERSAREQEEAARRRREQATKALEAARRVLSRLQQEG
ncbi:MAG: hypothetical protein E6J45_01315 [Chloroflexi bacterium]|nr:MAG: hypothetical protein E6J45_01315 [Chloroflexota bacterium]